MIQLHYVVAEGNVRRSAGPATVARLRLPGPPAAICRFCPFRAAIFIGLPRKFGPLPNCSTRFRGMEHPTWRHVIFRRFRGRRRTPAPEGMRMVDSADRFLAL